ncbi:glycosyltransferase family 2 protein [Salinivibrio kushneri]|uniref:glycosyltransferase family 2 protein n=1 Tax=Salinivibrio kushneri TaxID=1908198 RepID=UPI0022B4E601|nr:glycosyltransferase family 2 protein [Salinivibrio kushneri]WBA17124.1 glycosyltransferase family 2 protein [Salinivibrio kushneri]
MINKLKHILKMKKPHYCDGIVNDGIGGWCQGAKKVEIRLNNQYVATATCNLERPDLKSIVKDTHCGFIYKLDGAQLDPQWFMDSSIMLELIFYKDNNSKILATSRCVDTLMLLQSVVCYQSELLHGIADEIFQSNLWDDAFYKAQCRDSEVLHQNLIFDYILKGAKLGRNPSPYFNTYFYLATNKDVFYYGINPLYHYIKKGEQEGRKPNSDFCPESYLENNPDLDAWDASLLSHWVQLGIKEGRVYNEYPTGSTEDKTGDSYQTWRLNHETIKFYRVASNLNSFQSQPLISIVVPIYNPEKELLEACIDSVLAQSYSNWQLCLADDCSPEPHVREVLEKYQQLDARINIVFREKNGHISAASNSALEVAQGEWTALLDHDDELHEHALFHVVKAINKQPDVALIYSDEDKIDEHGQRRDPHFKSDWNLDLLYSQNYVSHLGVYKTDIVKKIGGFRVGYEGSQDYDLLLRYSREIDHDKIVHIPKVLYHWRMVEGSTAMGAGEKSYTTDAGIKALKDHFSALGQAVTVERGMHENIYKVNWMIEEDPLVSLIIPTHNGHEITKQAIDSIIDKSTYRNFEILLVDNNSNDPDTLAYFNEVDQHEQVKVLRYPYPFNYSAINNYAVKQAAGDIIGLVNNDVEVINPEWLTEMVSHAQRPDIGCVGAMLYYPSDVIQHAGVIVGLGGVAGHSHKHYPRGSGGYFNRLKVIQNYSAVTAACLLVRRVVFEQVNGLNETDLTVAFNDVDFCLKVKEAGYRNLWTPYAELYHYESISRGAEDNPEKIKRFMSEVEYMKRSWLTHEIPDPHYNANLTLAREDFTME